MAWTVSNNCRVRIWLNQVPGAAPIGPANYDGPAQQLAPLEMAPDGTWLTRVVLPAAAFGALPLTLGPIINPGGGNKLVLAMVDDASGGIVGYYLGSDLSWSTTPGPGAGQYQINCFFLSLLSNFAV